MILRNVTKDTVLANRAVMADTWFSRMKGLLGRASLGSGEALIISPSPSVHMLFMQFAIDVVFVDRQNMVVGLCPDLKPFQFSPVFWKSACAIELPAGTILASRTQVGDIIRCPPPNS